MVNADSSRTTSTNNPRLRALLDFFRCTIAFRTCLEMFDPIQSQMRRCNLIPASVLDLMALALAIVLRQCNTLLCNLEDLHEMTPASVLRRARHSLNATASRETAPAFRKILSIEMFYQIRVTSCHLDGHVNLMHSCILSQFMLFNLTKPYFILQDACSAPRPVSSGL